MQFITCVYYNTFDKISKVLQRYLRSNLLWLNITKSDDVHWLYSIFATLVSIVCLYHRDIRIEYVSEQENRLEQ